MEQNKILEGNLYKNILLFFAPIWLGTFFQQLYNTADAVIVGNFVSKQALAAVGGATGTIINLLIGLFVGISAGASVVIAQYMGAKNIDNASLAMHTAVALAIWGGVLLMAIGIPFSPMILKAMGTPQDILPYAVTYIRIYFAGSVFNLVYNIGSGILRAIGNSKKPLKFLIVASIVNIVLDIVFVVYLKMGIAGVGFATVISQFVSAVLVISSLSHLHFDFHLYMDKIKANLRMSKEIFAIGIPAGLQSAMYSISNIIIMASINSFGTDTVAAWTAFGKLDAVFWMTISSLGIAATTFVSQNYGAGNFDRMRKCVKVSLTISYTITIMISIFLYFGSPVLYRIFTQDPQVIQIGISIVHIMSPFFFAYVSIEVLSGALRGVGDSLIPTIITILGICALRISWVFFAVPIDRRIQTVVYGYPLTWIVTGLAFILYYSFGPWKKRVALKEAESRL